MPEITGDDRQRHRIEQARAHMTKVASGLVAVLGMKAAAETLAGALVGVLLGDSEDRTFAYDYLVELAVEVAHGEPDDPPEPAPTA